MYRFDFAISYAGEEAGIAADLCELLRSSGSEVFFADDHKVYLLGKRLRATLPLAFGAHTRFAVVIVSKHYVQKYWTQLEFHIARAEETQRDFEFILPLRIDDADLRGLANDAVYLDLRKEGIFRTADILIAKLRAIYPEEHVPTPELWVATLGVALNDLLDNAELPPLAPRTYPSLCDWLVTDLANRLSAVPLDDVRLVEEQRTGETLSVRISFRWDPRTRALHLGDIGWWEVLEVIDFAALYDTEDRRDTRRMQSGATP